MRQKESVFLTLLQGDQLDLVSLVEIQTSGTPLRYALDTEPRVWNSLTFAATSGSFGEIQESAEREVPSLQLVLQNVDGVLGPIVHPHAGGEDLRGRRVSIYQAARALLSETPALAHVIDWTFFVNSYQWVGREAVAFDLTIFPASSIRIPDRTLQGIRCRWVRHYKGKHCGYTGDLPTCEGTVQDCMAHFSGEGEAIRFGGFPSSADGRALRRE